VWRAVIIFQGSPTLLNNSWPWLTILFRNGERTRIKFTFLSIDHNLILIIGLTNLLHNKLWPTERLMFLEKGNAFYPHNLEQTITVEHFYISFWFQVERTRPRRVVWESSRWNPWRSGQLVFGVSADVGGFDLQEAVGASRAIRLWKHLPSGCADRSFRGTNATNFGSQ